MMNGLSKISITYFNDGKALVSGKLYFNDKNSQKTERLV